MSMIIHPNIPPSARRVLSELSTNCCIDSLILFGSRAVGDHEDGSDVDVAVCGANISRLQWARLRNTAYESKTLYWISLVHYDNNPSLLKFRIQETGVEIYVREKAARQPE
jgi:predicted nucleotidyltransferase